MRSKPLAILALLATSPAFAQGPGAPASTSNQPAIHVRQHGPMKLIGIPHPGSVTTSNWSGYAVRGTGFTKARGSWTVPKAKCGSDPDSYAAFWVGIDGYSSNTVEQIGTDSDCSGTTPVYYAWYEFYPNPAQQIGSMLIYPGDTMSATVSYNGTRFELKITDHTTAKTVSVLGRHSAKRSSAEWIAEAPADSSGNILPLADFTKVGMGDEYTEILDTNWATDSSVMGPISDFGSSMEKITMVTSGGTTKAKPSLLASDGATFDVTWKHK